MTVNGHVTVVDGGVYLDGTSAYLTAPLGTSNILTNPDKATDGFAFGIKLKFDSTAKEYDTPRYVLDTGAKSVGSTGFSFYVLNGRMFVELSSATMKWKVWILNLRKVRSDLDL